jgi:hypothetical protein
VQIIAPVFQHDILALQIRVEARGARWIGLRADERPAHLQPVTGELVEASRLT